MVGNEVARIDWSIEPRKTGSIMLMTMSRLSLCVSDTMVAGLTPGSLTLASMNVHSAATTAAQRSRRNGFVDVNTGKWCRCHLRLGAWLACRAAGLRQHATHTARVRRKPALRAHE